MSNAVDRPWLVMELGGGNPVPAFSFQEDANLGGRDLDGKVPILPGRPGRRNALSLATNAPAVWGVVPAVAAKKTPPAAAVGEAQPAEAVLNALGACRATVGEEEADVAPVDALA